MLKKILFGLLIFVSLSALTAQTTLIDPAGDGGFESGTTFAANGWSTVFVPPIPGLNQWAVNTGAIGYTGNRCAYITNDLSSTPPPHAYNDNNEYNYFIYRDINFPVGENDITLSFDWRGNGDAGNDRMTIWLVPVDYDRTFAANQTITAFGTAPTGRVQIGDNFSGESNWTTETFTIPSAYAGNTARLYIEWTNNNDGNTYPDPIAIDNVSLVTETVIAYCSSTSNNSSGWIESVETSVGGASDISNTLSGFTAPNGYQDNTATQVVEQFPGGIVDFIADFSGTIPTFGFNIWVDWTNDGDFDDADELVFFTGEYLSGVNSDFTIPPYVLPGDYTMRLRADEDNPDPDPCSTIDDGETEDYTLRVPSVSCTDDPSNVVISAIGISSATVSWMAASPVPAGGYEYYITTTNAVPSYTQTATGTTAATSINLTGLNENTEYYVWIRSICDGSAGGSGLWLGPELFTTLVTPPVTTGVSICPGDPSMVLTASAYCVDDLNLGTQLSGALEATSPVANQPDLPILGGGSQNFCAFDTHTSNYDAINFSVDATGTYTFTLQSPTPYFDAMAYIVLNDGNFTPGTCAVGSTWLLGDDDSGPGFSPQLVVNLTAGVSYTIITTKWTSSTNTTHTGSYTWDLSGPGSVFAEGTGTMDWYTTAVGGTPIGSGSNFDPVGVTGSGLPDTNTPGVYTFWAACSGSSSTRTQADYVIGKVWTGATDSNWNTVSNWSPSGVPTATDCVVITNTGFSPIADGTTDGIGGRLIVQNGATLTQQPNSILTFTGAITVDAGGTYTMLDSASLFQDPSAVNTVNGTFNMERIATIRENDYVYWSSPVEDFPIEDLSPGTTGYKYEWTPTLPQGISPPPGSVNMLYGEWQSYNTGAMAIGKGYIVKGPVGHGSSAAPFTAEFSGTPNNGTIVKSIERGTHTSGTYTFNPYGGDLLTITDDDDNWNLIGNPYPSALSIEDFLDNNQRIEGFVYLWTHGTDIGAGNPDPFYDDYAYNYNVADYIAINSFGESTPTGNDQKFIGAGQGFFVLMKDDALPSESVTFQNYMRRASGYRNDLFYRSANTTEDDTSTKHRIWLDYIDPSGSTNTTLVGYAEGATNEKDRMYDAKNNLSNGLNLYSMINDEAYIIQGRQTPFVDSDTVPLGINISEAGIQTIAINTVDGLFQDTDQQIYIEDLVTGIIHNLNNAPYTFTSEIGAIEDRFILRYTESTLGVANVTTLNGIKVFKENDNIVVQSEYEALQSIEVYDLLGRNLFTNSSIKLKRYSIAGISPKTATLFLKIKLVNGQQKIAKLIF